MTLEQILEVIPIRECKCKICKSYCINSCWPTPQEAQTIIDAGYEDKLVLDCWYENKPLYLLSPGNNKKTKGNECIFLNSKKLCEIHSIKPIEGKLAFHCGNKKQVEVYAKNFLRIAIAQEWQTAEAKQLIKDWKKKYFKPEVRK